MWLHGSKLLKTSHRHRFIIEDVKHVTGRPVLLRRKTKSRSDPGDLDLMTEELTLWQMSRFHLRWCSCKELCVNLHAENEIPTPTCHFFIIALQPHRHRGALGNLGDENP